jgi:hypothetical protein
MRASVDASGPFGTPIRHPGRDDPGAPGRERRRGGPNQRHRLLCTGLHSDSGQPPGGGADKALSYAIVGVGGFLGVGEHEIAVPVGRLKQLEGKIVLPGATKDTLKAVPKFEYAK